MLDKTPAWIHWTLLQAVKLDGDLMQKISAVTGGLFGGHAPAGDKVKHPASKAEEKAALEGAGFIVRRGK